MCVAWKGGGAACLDALDPREVEAYLSTDARGGREATYGVPVDALREAARRYPRSTESSPRSHEQNSWSRDRPERRRALSNYTATCRSDDGQAAAVTAIIDWHSRQAGRTPISESLLACRIS